MTARRPPCPSTPAQPDADQYGQPEVILYATSWCGYCKAAREFFAANGIEYIELDIEKSAAAQRALSKVSRGGAAAFGLPINAYLSRRPERP